MIRHRYPEVDKRLSMQAVSRTLDVLECFAASPRPKSLGDISAETEMNKSAVQRIARTLVSRGYLEQDERGLMLGKALLDRGFDYLRSNPLIERASPIMTDLRRETGERVDLSLFDPYHDNLSIIYAVRMQSKRETFYATLPGRRFPAALTSGGRACMAMLSGGAVDDILAHSDLIKVTPCTIVDPLLIKEKIEFGRNHGFCFSIEESLLGEIVLAAAIKNNSGDPIGAIHIAGSLSQWEVDAFCERFSPLAMNAAAAISG